MNTDVLLSELSAVVGPDAIRAPAETSLPSGWTTQPFAALHPVETDQIGPLVCALEAAHAALIPLGGGSKLSAGYPPRDDRPYALLQTGRLNRILDYQPDDMTVTCEPGVTLAALQEMLAARRQRLSLDVPLPRRATLGGIISANESGFDRPTGGAPRDLLIGLRAVMTGGVYVKGGGRVVKNVAGYDVCKLFTGAWGTLGVVTELTFKVTTRPEVERMLAFPAPDPATAARVGLSLHHTRLAASSFLASNELNGPLSGRPCLVIGLQGGEQRVRWQSEEYARLAAQAGLTEAPHLLASAQVEAWCDRQARLEPEVLQAVRVACLPTDLEGALARLAAAAPGLALTAHCASGVLSLASADPALIPQQIVAALPSNAHRVWTRLEPATPDADRVERWGPPRADFALHRALKQALDPNSTFSPGRFIGRL